MAPSASENSFLKPPATSVGLPPKQQQQARYEPLPMAKIKAWRPSDVGNDDEYDQQHQQQQQRRSDRNRNHRSSEVDDSLQYFSLCLTFPENRNFHKQGPSALL